ncbi:MAG TPA: Rieske 2Fe-2S domain-containing protein, partial [Fibrella sp.]
NLQTKGGYVTEQKVIIAQTMAGDFIAVSSVCTHDNNAVVFQGANNRFYCAAHMSAFGTNGAVKNGPAVKPLKTYTVTVNQTTGDIRVQG